MITLSAIDLEVSIDAGSVDVDTLEREEQAAYRRLEDAKAVFETGKHQLTCEWEISQAFEEIRRARQTWRLAAYALGKSREARRG